MMKLKNTITNLKAYKTNYMKKKNIIKIKYNQFKVKSKVTNNNFKKWRKIIITFKNNINKNTKI